MLLPVSVPATCLCPAPSRGGSRVRAQARIAVLAFLIACASAEKLGDRAAAVGDWKSAERQYAEALQKDPGNAEKKAKYAQARQNALGGAVAAARACQAAQDWECVYAESDYVLRLDAGNAEMATLRADSARQVGFLRLRGAQDASGRRDHKAAFGLYDRARAVTSDPGVQAEAARVAPGLVRGAVEDAQRARAAQQYPAAIELLTLAVNVDGRVRPQLDEARAEYDRWLDQQAEVEAQQGDGLLRERRFAEAQAHYEAAQKYRKGGRAEPLGRYARSLAQGEQAVRKKDWARAAAAYEEAMKSGMDQTRFAAAELERVRIRPYAIRIRSVLVKPFRPDGSPWAGVRTREFERLQGMLAVAAVDGSGASGRAAMEAYDALPHDNKPDLFVSIVLPDGREFVTVPQRTIRARLDSMVAFNTNSYDERRVAVRVLHADRSRTVEIGTLGFRVVDAVGGELRLAERSVVELRLAVEPSPLRDGQTQGFTLVETLPVREPTPSDPPPPKNIMMPRVGGY
jgi:tetratricopeptide (TPR) repeat protein